MGISIIKTDHGTYNVIGIKAGAIILQGSLEEDDLNDLQTALDEAREEN